MIAFAFFAVIALISAFYAIGLFQVGSLNKGIAFVAIAALSLLAGAFLWPISDAYTDSVRNRQMQANAQAEAEAARTMIAVLGSSEAYIRYMEIKKGQ